MIKHYLKALPSYQAHMGLVALIGLSKSNIKFKVIVNYQNTHNSQSPNKLIQAFQKFWALLFGPTPHLHHVGEVLRLSTQSYLM